MVSKRMVMMILLAILCWGILSAGEKDKVSNQSELTIKKIMRDPKWIGSSPKRIRWSEDGEKVYFMWNPENAKDDSLYVVSRDGGEPRKVTISERKKLPSPRGDYNQDETRKVYSKNGDIFVLDISEDRIMQITHTVDRESNPRFTHDEKKITFVRDNNLYLYDLINGKTVQLTDFRKGKKKEKDSKPKTKQERWLNQEELDLIQVLKERKEKEELEEKHQEVMKPKRPKHIYIQDKRVSNIQLSPDERYVTFSLYQRAKNAERTIVPNYVTESGFTKDIPSRTKVGRPDGTYQFGIYDFQKDTVYFAITAELPGIYDKPDYLQEYKEKEKKKEQGKRSKKGQGEEKKSEKKKAERGVILHGPYWSEDGQYAVMLALSQDNKDRWIVMLDIETGKLQNLDRQHDEAWIGGPGISGWWSAGNVGWMPDNRHFWLQSEETGYSHLYTVDVTSGKKEQLTRGEYEIYSPKISKDEKYWYFTANKVHPGVRHFYRMPLEGGKTVQITSRTGNSHVSLSPNDEMLAIRYSSSNRPWELYLMENEAGATPERVTSSLSDEFLSYPWREPEIVTFKARDGAEVYARLYRPEEPESNGPAVIFVHGAGYLQNAHKWWSSYFREYMFHNILVDNGYTILDIDYRGSAGYGRDWRTAIYRHMGGKDLSDQVDGAKFLIDKYDVDPERIGMYGGSYGGFITLMAMFTVPDVFDCGAALRPVTDWAHYNHPYTSNILNVPYADSLAYVRSSPIYHAEGLEGNLLICHGMIDTNVHFQGVVRLVQRLIELGKEDWEVAIYPLESHGFREPSSWTDEYRRIYKLFEENLK